jgi:hypothetical protein
LATDGEEKDVEQGPSRAASRRKKPQARSRIGTGSTLLVGIDQRSGQYREYQDAVADLVHHLGSDPSATEMAMVEECAGLIVWCRSERLKLLQGAEFNVGPYTTAVNSLRRLLVDLGMERKMKPVHQTVSDWIRAQAIDVDVEADDVD